MGNDGSKNAFKGQGKSLDGNQTVVGKGKEKKTTQAWKRATGTVQKPTQASKPERSAEEVEEERAKRAAAAAARSGAWEQRLERQREQRKKEMTEEATVQGGGLAANSALEQLQHVDHTALAEQLDKDAKNLEQSGFNYYQSVSVSAAQANTMQNMEGLTDEKQEEEQIDVVALANQQLDVAISDQVDVNKLNAAIDFVHSMENLGDHPETMEKLGIAVSLRDALLESTHTTVVAAAASASASASPPPPAPPADETTTSEAHEIVAGAIDEIGVFATVQRESSAACLKTMLKVMDNIKQNPSEEKFRKLRLTNPKIKDSLVEVANGAPLRILGQLGFKQEGEFLQLNSATDQNFVIKYDPIHNALNNLLNQLQ